MRRLSKPIIWRGITLLSLLLLGLALYTYPQLQNPPHYLQQLHLSQIAKPQILDRHRRPLTITYQNRWNIHDYRPLHQIPQILQQFFIQSEDQRFYQHNGIDWQARLHALWQNLQAGRVVRGASTISEQVVRILNPRPRRLWSRWLETWEAWRLEAQISKADILTFYLNQVPYGNQQRGVVQAARYYFDRDLDTLNIEEMLALVVLIRSPSRLNLRKYPNAIKKPLKRLAKKLQQQHLISASDYQQIGKQPLELGKRQLPLQAAHFVRYLLSKTPKLNKASLHTSLDANLQQQIQSILDQRLIQLQQLNVHNGAALVVDHHTQEVLAWVNAGDFFSKTKGSQIDAIISARQPGSTLKPLLYALALQKGWTAASLIKDAPLAVSIGEGLHNYHNYSFVHYGNLRLRDALGNSLNTPAVRTLQYVGVNNFLDSLKSLGMYNLSANADYYGDGLALGNGAVSLLELVQAYTVLARQGQFQALKLQLEQDNSPQHRVFSSAISSIIANILSDSDARRLEFGRNSILQFPYQTAVKTGTSNDYHDAWALGFNHHYTVGVWLGNLDQTPMQQVSGSLGSVLILRSIFSELNRGEIQKPLYLDPSLEAKAICREDGRAADNNCQQRLEWFIPGTAPIAKHAKVATSTPKALSWIQPREGLQIAKDPRIPDQQEAFLWQVNPNKDSQLYQWVLNDQIIAQTHSPRYHWRVTTGKHKLYVKSQNQQGQWQRSRTIGFWVKGNG